MQEKSGWWYALAVCHVYVIFMALGHCYELVKVLYRTAKTSKGDAKNGVGTAELLKRLVETLVSVIRTCGVPILTGIVLYLPVTEAIVRYCTAVCVILTW